MRTKVRANRLAGRELELKRLRSFLHAPLAQWLLGLIFFTALTLGAAALILPSDSAPLASGEWHGNQSGLGEPQTVIVRDEGRWQALWKHLGKPPPVPLQEGSQVGIAVFTGSRPSPDYGIRLLSAAPRDGRLIVVWEELRPPEDRVPPAARGGSAAQVMATPWMVLLIDRGDLPALVERRTQR